MRQKVPVRPVWRAAFASKRVFALLLAVAGRFDRRPGRLYSLIGRKPV